MATLFDRRRTPLDRLSSAVPAIPPALIALVGDALLSRGSRQARNWVVDTVSRGMRESRRNVKPLRKAAKRELSKTEQLKEVVPFYPAVPLIPFAIVAGLTTVSTILAVRVSRRDREILARLDAIEAELACVREARGSREQSSDTAEPAQLPWT